MVTEGKFVTFITFLILLAGYYISYFSFSDQVGKFMKCKWHGEDEGDFPGGRSERLNSSQSGFTTVSHSCQIFVTGIS